MMYLNSGGLLGKSSMRRIWPTPKIAEEIDKPENLAMFPDEGALGFWLQCNMGTTIKGFSLKSGGLHGDLHAHWVRQGNTDHGLGNTSSNVDNYMFWKLHGWMDNVWEKYRAAKGLKRTDQKYVDDMLAPCHEMDIEAEICRTGAKPVDMTTPLPVESGFFHEKVRAIFEAAANKCSGCHSAAGPEAGMSLGGHISSKDIVAGLVNQQAVGGGQFKAHRARSARSKLALSEDHGDGDQLHGHQRQPVLPRSDASLGPMATRP